MRLAYAAVLLAACASTPKTVLVDGREVQRPTLTFAGQPFNLRHVRAYPNPGSPSGGLSSAGGDIHVHVCGMNVDYEVLHAGDHVQLTGNVDGPLPSEIEVREDGRARMIRGRLGGMSVAIELRSDALIANVGKRVFALETMGDDLRGVFRLDGGGGAAQVVLHGLRALEDMPAADQGALLPGLLTCAVPYTPAVAVSTLVVGVGGASTDVPSQSSALYTRGR
jgi:hypothetical protein